MTELKTPVSKIYLIFSINVFIFGPHAFEKISVNFVKKLFEFSFKIIEF